VRDYSSGIFHFLVKWKTNTGKIGFLGGISTLISVTAENWSYTSYLFFTPVRQIIVFIKSVT
jgi:hypothetical protein